MVSKDLDPVDLQILWSRLIAIADEQTAMVLRTAFSTILRESQDFSCVVLTRSGDLLAQPFQSLPGFTRSASTVMKHFLSKWPDWHEGDVAVTNDPWISSGHLLDVAIAVPVFHRGRLVAFCANIAHQADMGGRGYSAEANSIFEEGLAIPPMKLFRGGTPVQEVFDIIAENVRVPNQVLGDIQSQIVAARLGARRVSDLMDEFGIETLEDIAEEIMGRSEQSMRAAIGKVANGVYESEGILDGWEEPLFIRLKMTVADDDILFDFSGTSPQVAKGINSCYNYTYGYAAFATKSVLEPHVPNNEGAYRPIQLTAPEASLINSRRPAPGTARGRVGHMVVPVVFGALAKALPDVVPAEPGSPAPRLNFSGTHPDGRPFQCLLLTSGGLGGANGRDGLPGKAFPTNTKMASLEIMETEAPLRFVKREIIPDTAGKGTYRGGPAQEIAIEILDGDVSLSTSCERIKFPPRGYQGGKDGSTALLWKNADEYVPPKGRIVLQPHDVVTARTPSGAGYGDPATRSAELIARDIEQGYVSAAPSGAQETGRVRGKKHA